MRGINPATGDLLREYPETAPEEVPAIIEAAVGAQRQWRRLPFAARAPVLERAAALLRQRRDDLARLAALEMGKPIREGRAEIDKCAWVCQFYAERAAEMLAREEVATDARSSFVTFNPLGVVLAVMPWNFPFWQVFRFAAPALMAGNAGLLKHASNVPGCALAIEQVLHDAGLPTPLFRTLLVPSAAIAEIIAHPGIAAVTLTGSEGAGRAVAACAGAHLKKTVLELGGSDAYVVLADADLEHAARVCAAARLINSGQSCIAAKRFVVERTVLERFTVLFTSHMRAARVGDPLDETTEVGPLARRDLRDQLHGQVQASVAKGARCVLGGEIPPGPGAYYPPTVLTQVAPGMPAWEEELFGPVAAIIAAEDEHDAVRIANDSSFGLGAAVFTGDAPRGERLAAEELDAGSCFVNAAVRSDPRLPFGGIKLSGYGRELSHYGIKEFVNIKTVWVG
jgi:succinate-semialdehyde dehydrogenase/glutarate-semialdehyde dehydrogenase